MHIMKKDLRKRIINQAQKPTGVRNLKRLKNQLQSLAQVHPPPDYDRYIRSKAWKIKRAQLLEHYAHTCVLCGTQDHLHVHHLHYQTVGQETPEDVAVCCRRCHFIEHLPHNDDPNWVNTSSASHVPKRDTH